MNRTLVLLLLLAASVAPSRAQTHVQDCQSHPANATNPMTCVFSSPVGAGHLIVGLARTGTTTNSISSAADTGGSSYSFGTVLYNANPFGGATTQMFYTCSSAASSSDTISITMASAANNIYMTVSEFSGVAASSCLDAAATGAIDGGSGGTTAQSNSAATSNAADLLVGFATGSGVTWTAGVNGQGGTYSLGATNGDVALEYINVSSTNTYSASFAISPPNYWNAHLAAFKAAGGASRRRIIIAARPRSTSPLRPSSHADVMDFLGATAVLCACEEGTRSQ